jgi:hypothetical protein
MKSSIYIASDKVDVVTYSGYGKKLKIKRHETIPVEEGTLFNGKILDREALVECGEQLRKMDKRFLKNVTLVIDGALIYNKIVTTPKRLSNIQYLRLAEDTFTDTKYESELLYSYTIISEKRAIAYAIETDQLRAYTSLMNDLGIEVKSIRIGVESIIRLAKLSEDIDTTSCVLNMVDSSMMLSVVMNDGQPVFITRARINSDTESIDIASISKGLSGIMQFVKSERLKELTHSYYIGTELDEIEVYDYLKNNSQIEGHTVHINDYGSSMSVVNAYTSHETKVNLLKAAENLEKIKRSRKSRSMLIPIAALLVMIVAIPYYLLHQENNMLESLIEPLFNYANNSDTVASVTYLMEIENNVEKSKKIIEQYEFIKDGRRRKQDITDGIMDFILTAETSVQIQEMDYVDSNSSIRVSGLGETQRGLANYIEKLREDGRIDSVDYSGYGDGQDEKFSFSADIILKENAAEENKDGEVQK